MDRRFPSCCLFYWSKRATLALLMPRREIIGIRQTPKEHAYIRICFWIGNEDGVVRVPVFLSPGVKHGLFPGVVRLQRRDDAFTWIIKQSKTDSDLHVEFKAMSVTEKRFETADGFAFVIKDGPTTADPARTGDLPGEHRLIIVINED